MLLVGIALLLTSCSTIFPTVASVTEESSTSPSVGFVTITDAPNTVRLSQKIIDAGVADCKDKTAWGIDLPTMTINYLTGVALVAAIVLHNGNSSEMYVTVTSTPTFETIVDSENGVTYQPSPNDVIQYLKPEVDSVTLNKMETKVVYVTLLVPNTVKSLPNKWAVAITANGYVFEPYKQQIIVTTEDNDDTLVFHLDSPLMNGLQSILSLNSSLTESLKATSYDEITGMLTITGLQSNQVREIDVNYIPRPSSSIAYEQDWLITMLN